MNILNTIRYMGIKTNLLSEIIPAIKEITAVARNARNAFSL